LVAQRDESCRIRDEMRRDLYGHAMTTAAPTTETERLAALARYQIVGHRVGPDLSAIVRLAAQVCAAPGAVINLIDATHQWQPVAVGMVCDVYDRSEVMCQHTIRGHAVVHVADASADDRFSDNPFVTGVRGAVRMYASAPLVTPDGHVIGTLCVVDDTPRSLSRRQLRSLRDLADQVVTQLEIRRQSRLAEDQLASVARANRELETVNEDLTRFAFVAAHDLKSPLAGVTGFAELLARHYAGDLPEPAREAVGYVVEGCRRMNVMVDDLLRYSRAGSEPLDLVSVPLDDVVAEAVHNVQAAVRATQADIQVDPMPVVRGNRTQLVQLMQNLIGNAVKFAGHLGSGSPRVTVSATAARAGWWRVSVSDNGPGVPAESRDRIFAMFERVDHTVEGSGIGLATCKRIVERYGGVIEVGAAQGGGAAFYFTVPAG
jgi:signal transduction histidine kinase